MQQAKPIKNNSKHQYRVYVTTGNCNGASTDATIRIKLYGSNGCTNFIELENCETYQVPFNRDQTDRFTIKTHCVGQLFGITIGHDQTDISVYWTRHKR
jgi:hypothetical protein